MAGVTSMRALEGGDLALARVSFWDSSVQLRPEIDIDRRGASSLPQWPRGYRINHMEAAVGGELDGTCCQVVVTV